MTALISAYDADRFFAKVNKNGPRHRRLGTRCHLWIAGKRAGYGDFWLKGKQVLAHRVAWLLKYGRWPDPQALHHCDNKPCVNVDHLFEGTQRDNMADKIAKGRSTCGTLVNTAKLDEELVLKIRAMYESGNYTQKQIANEFSIKQPQVSSIVRGESWKALLEERQAR